MRTVIHRSRLRTPIAERGDPKLGPAVARSHGTSGFPFRFRPSLIRRCTNRPWLNWRKMVPAPEGTPSTFTCCGVCSLAVTVAGPSSGSVIRAAVVASSRIGTTNARETMRFAPSIRSDVLAVGLWPKCWKRLFGITRSGSSGIRTPCECSLKRGMTLMITEPPTDPRSGTGTLNCEGWIAKTVVWSMPIRLRRSDSRNSKRGVRNFARDGPN